jgi:hypothetical protein
MGQRIQDSVFSIVTSVEAEQPRNTFSIYGKGQEIFLFMKEPSWAVRPICPRVQVVPEVLFPGLKRPDH